MRESTDGTGGENTFGQRVKRHRLWRHLTQQELADLAGPGWTKSLVSMVENGRRRADTNREKLDQLATALRVNPEDLLGHPAPLGSIPGLAAAQADLPALEAALMDAGIGDDVGIDPRPLAELEQQVYGPLMAAGATADDIGRMAMLPGLITELQVYGRDETALRLLTIAAHDAVHGLRNIGQVALAWIAAERSMAAATLLGDEVMIGVAEYARAHARPTGARLARAGDAADRICGAAEGEDRWAQEVYGMLRLTAALGAQVRGDAAAVTDHAGEASRVADRHGESASMWRQFGSFGPANVGVWKTTLAVEAGEPGRALTTANAIDTSALRKSRQAALLLDVGRAHHQLGRDHDRETVAALRQAEHLAPVRMRASPWARDLVETMLVQSRREAGGRELRGLAYRMGLGQ